MKKGYILKLYYLDNSKPYYIPIKTLKEARKYANEILENSNMFEKIDILKSDNFEEESKVLNG